MNNSKLKQLNALNQQEGLKVTMTLPTHRTAPDNKQDPIVFKNLASMVSDKLLEKMDHRQAEPYLKQLEMIGNDKTLFTSTLEGLVVYVTKESSEIIKMAHVLEKSVQVSEHLNLLPVLNYYDEQQEVLAIDLSKDRFKVFNIDSYSIDEIELDGVHQNFKDLFDDYDTQSTLSFGSYAGPASYHGHRDASQEIDNDTEKYFRYIDREIQKRFKDDKRPLVVYSTTENIVDFKEVSDLKFTSINRPLKGTPVSEILESASCVLMEKTKQAQQKLQARLDAAYAKRLVSNNLVTILKDVADGRVEMILVKDEMNSDLNELIKEARQTSVEIHFIKDLEQPVLAINRY